MNSTAAAATFSGSRASWRCARGRTSSFHRPTGPVTQRRRQGTGGQSGGGTPPRPGRGHPPPTPAPHPRQRARPHLAATTPLTRPTPAPPAAATPQRTPARRAGVRDALQRPAHDLPLPLLQPQPAVPHHRAARHSYHPVCSRQPADRPSHAGGHLETTGSIRAGSAAHAHSPYAPQWGREREFCQVAAVNRTGLRSRERSLGATGHSERVERPENGRRNLAAQWRLCR
jgi:hypothetical protein